MRATALEKEQAALALRLLRVLNLSAGVEVSPAELGEADVVIASPATLVWIAKIEAQVDPLTARMLLLQLIECAPTGMIVAEALFLLAGLEMDAAFFDEAADYYQRILDDYFGYERWRAAVLRGDALRMARRYEDAIEAYSLLPFNVSGGVNSGRRRLIKLACASFNSIKSTKRRAFSSALIWPMVVTPLGQAKRCWKVGRF